MKKNTFKKLNRKLLTASILSAALCSQPQAAPLPNGTLLSIEQDVSSTSVPCSSGGSCFGMEVAPGLVIWTTIGPGIDGGIVIGKNQASGGQELAPSAANATSGEITDAWNFFANFGTFYTPSGATDNFFGDTSCVGPACIGVTQLGSLNVAWNGASVPMGSANGCNSSICSPDELAGDYIIDYTISGDGNPWSIHYHNVVPDGDPSSFGNVKFQLLAKGIVVMPTQIPTPTPAPTPTPTPTPLTNNPPIAYDLTVFIPYDLSVTWTPNVIDPDGHTVFCDVSQPPPDSYNTTVTIASDCSSGTITSFVPIDSCHKFSFTYSARDQYGEYSNQATVTVDIDKGCSFFEPTPTPAPTPECTPGPIPVPPPPAEPISLSTIENQSVTWGSLEDSCNGIISPPLNGTATLTGCQGTYTPFAQFTGNDSLVYNQVCTVYTDSCTNVSYDLCTAQPVEIEVKPAVCESLHPQSEVTMIGKGKNLETEETMTTTFKGHIVSTDESKGKVTICPGTTVGYEVTSTVGTAKCAIHHAAVEATGTLTDKSKLVCTNKPDGNDVDKFKIKRSKKDGIAIERRWFK